MHGEDALLGHEVVHDREDALLDLARVLAAGNEDHLLLIVDHDGGLAVDVVPLGDALEAGGGDDGEVRLVIGQLLLGGAQEELVDEEVLAGQLVDDAEGLGVLGVRAGEAVEDKDLAVLEVGHHLLVEGVKDLLGGGDVDLAPGDVVMDAGGVDDELVVGGPAGVLAGVDAECAGVVEIALAPGQGLLHQLGGREVAVDGTGIDDAQGLQAIGFHDTCLLFLYEIGLAVQVQAAHWLEFYSIAGKNATGKEKRARNFTNCPKAPLKPAGKFMLLGEEDGIRVLHEIVHAVQDGNAVRPHVRGVLGHGGLVIAQVQEVDLRKVAAEEGGEAVAVAVPDQEQLLPGGRLRIAHDIQRRVAPQEGGIFVLLPQEAVHVQPAGFAGGDILHGNARPGDVPLYGIRLQPVDAGGGVEGAPKALGHGLRRSQRRGGLPHGLQNGGIAQWWSVR